MKRQIRKLLGLPCHDRQIQQEVRSQQRHSLKSPEEWRVYWQSQGQAWRMEPEIGKERQQELNRWRSIASDTETEIYPFKGVKLSRADVEWLLATHENGCGPVDWSDERQRERAGLDLRGAHLQYTDLRGLPLAKMLGGLHRDEWQHSSLERCEVAAIQLERADLRLALLEGADLHYAHLERVDLRYAHVEGADLTKIHFQQADLNSTFFEEADFSSAHVESAYLGSANLKKAILKEAHLEGVDLYKAHLEGAVLCSAFFDNATQLNDVVLGDEKSGFVFLVDVRWNDVNLAVVNWSKIMMLGDERVARQPITTDGIVKSREMRLDEYGAAVRANHQLAVELQNQGLNEDAARFAYRAQGLQRKVFWKRRDYGKWFFSLFLALVAGYGYRMWRILAAYLLVVLLCAGAYYVLGIYYEPHLSFLEAILTSITAFNGRVFAEPFLHPGEPQLWVTAIEAVAGLLIEGVFIAMLTQRFFGK